MFVTSNKSLLDQLSAFKTAGLDGTGPTHSSVKLAQGAFAPLPDSDPTTFTECTFDGYSSKTVAAWTGPYLAPNASAEVIAAAVLSWTPTGTTTPNLCSGYWIELANGDYAGGEAFDTPVALNGPTTTLNLVPVWQTAPGAFSGNVLT